MDGRVKPGHDDLSPPRTNKTTGNATRATNCIDKIRNVRYMLLLTESLPAQRLPGPCEGSPRLFEMFATTTAACEREMVADFLI
jgi:hypothetical protein